MSRRHLFSQQRRRAFTEAVRSVRKLRGLRAQEVADRMGFELRSYERFEHGEGRLEVDRIFLFAEVTDSDPYALLFALGLEKPQLASRCADNKLLMIAAISLERLDGRLGEGLRRLEAATLIDAFERAFGELAQAQEARDVQARRWLARKDPDPDMG